MSYNKLSTQDKIINWIIYHIVLNFIYYIIYPIKFNTKPFNKNENMLTKKDCNDFLKEVNLAKNNTYYTIYNLIKMLENTPYMYINCIDRYITLKIRNISEDHCTVRYLYLYESYISDKPNNKIIINNFLEYIQNFELDIQLWILSLIMIKIGYCKYIICN